MELMKDVVESDVPEALNVLKDITKASAECLQNIKALIFKVKEGPPTSEGMSFLDVKNQLMTSYMANMALLMDKKLYGQSINGHPSIDRLVEIRTVLEKMRPIEHKLKYQINKLIRAYKDGDIDPSDPRKFRPNFGAFSSAADADTSADEDDEKKKDPNQLYVAPKLAPAHYSDDETQDERLRKESEKKRRKSLNSTMLRELREQYTDAPMEIVDNSNLLRFKESKQEQERTDYEETNFIRLSVSKREEKRRNKVATMASLGSLANFDNMADLYNEGQGEDSSKKKKRSRPMKSGKGKFGKKGSKPKRRKR